MSAKPIVLIGLSGSGKSAVAPLLANRLGRASVDIDQVVSELQGCSVADLFATKGESFFRDCEAQAFAETVESSPKAVIAGGGGLVTGSANMGILRDRCVVVWLNPPLKTLTRRLAGDGEVRPLLADPDALKQQYADRLGFYSIAADVVITSEADPGAVVEQIIEEVDGYSYQTQAEQVRLGDGRTYDVHVGRGAVSKLRELLPDTARRAAIVTQGPIGVDVDPGIEHRTFTVEDGERAKRLETVAELTSEFAQWGLTRNDVVISVGGGVVSDLAGFVAATYHRGLPVVHVSTTLLGQIDAAIGGKTGVNLPEGKNLVGAFWQPHGVICDSDHLVTLPPREFRAGMGELAKYHFLGGGHLDELPMTQRVAACVRIKADLVAADEREGGLRAILNYGHTLAHALETSGKYGLRHGEAVAVGLVYAAELALRLGRIDTAAVAEHRRIVDAYGLSSTIPTDADADEVIRLFARDKKALDGITFVLDGPNGVESVIVDDESVLRDALEAVR